MSELLYRIRTYRIERLVRKIAKLEPDFKKKYTVDLNASVNITKWVIPDKWQHAAFSVEFWYQKRADGSQQQVSRVNTYVDRELKEVVLNDSSRSN